MLQGVLGLHMQLGSLLVARTCLHLHYFKRSRKDLHDSESHVHSTSVVWVGTLVSSCLQTTSPLPTRQLLAAFLRCSCCNQLQMKRRFSGSSTLHVQLRPHSRSPLITESLQAPCQKVRENSRLLVDLEASFERFALVANTSILCCNLHIRLMSA